MARPIAPLVYARLKLPTISKPVTGSKNPRFTRWQICKRGLQSNIHSYTRVPNGMNLDKLTEDELKDLILQKQLEWIKLCQDDFLIFAGAMWEDFIYRKTKDPKKYGHHQISAELRPELCRYHPMLNLLQGSVARFVI